ncbi:MAG: ABC transporter permease [Chloroflexi bacterium]|nr:MAG: ABC transporter permease [Chloroflexota bacterium]
MRKNQSLALQLALGIAPIIISLVITAIIILVVGADPAEVVERVWSGAFRDLTSTARVVNFWLPLTLASIGLTITFTAGLWNIGVEGQIMVGALFATFASREFASLPTAVVIPIEIIFAVVGGMLWALLVGVLKTRLGIHEIFGGVALNALADVGTIFLVSNAWAPATGATAQASERFAPSTLFPALSGDFPVNWVVAIVTVIAAIVVIFSLRGTRWGLHLKATGKNPRSALLLGVPTERTALSAFAACGALAGIAGAHRVLFTFGDLRPLASGGIGFLGLLVVLLVSIRVLWVPLATFVFAAIITGSTRLRISLQLDQSLAGVLQGTLVLVVILFQGVRQRLEQRVTQGDGDEPQQSFSPISAEMTE